jgi:hypothetical protein
MNPKSQFNNPIFTKMMNFKNLLHNQIFTQTMNLQSQFKPYFLRMMINKSQFNPSIIEVLLDRNHRNPLKTKIHLINYSTDKPPSQLSKSIQKRSSFKRNKWKTLRTLKIFTIKRTKRVL